MTEDTQTTETNTQPETTVDTTTDASQGNWRDLVKDEELKTKFKHIDDVDTLARSYDGMLKKMGDPDSYLKIPGEDDPKDEFYAKIGVPAKADDYEINMESIPEPLRDDAFVDTMRQAAFDAKVPKESFEKMVETYNATQAERYQQSQEQQEAQYKEAYEKAKEKLAPEWGSEFDARLEKANKFLEENANNPAFIKAVYKMANGDEDGFEKAGSNVNMSSIDDRIADINKLILGKNPEINSMHPRYESLLKEQTELFRKKLELQGSR